jgi:ABC-type glycerol-3-phosphate transport system permease component
MVGTSLKSLSEAATPSLKVWPSEWHWENYREAFSAAPFIRYFWNSFLVSGCVTLSVVFTSLLAGYAFARLRFPAKSVLFFCVLATMMVPFEAALIPNFVLITRLDWYNRYAALIVPWCANAFSIFLVRQAFLSLHRDYADAARIDGCGPLRFLFYIGAPLIKPTLVTVALFAFLGSYNALLWPLVVTSEDTRRVVQVGLMAFAGDAGVRVHLLMAAATLVICPTVVLYLFAQRYIEEGIRSGGIRG